MTARIRNLNIYDILTLNTCFKMNETTNFWNFEDVKYGLLHSKKLNLNISFNELQDGKFKLVTALSNYDINYIHNI